MKTQVTFYLHHCRPARPPRAFTLIELMISIALVVLLILGVNQVFEYTTQAVGSGEAINAAIRSSRAAQGVFDRDFKAMVGYGPGAGDSGCMILSSRANYSYRDAKDQASQVTIDSTGVATGLPNAAFRDIDGNGKAGETAVNGEVIYPDNYNYRNHRLDVLSFFARSQYSRQTGNPGTFVANEGASEAWIWYGHLWLPNNNGQFATETIPTSGSSSTNPNNYFGSQLVLGRQSILMQSPNTAGDVVDNQGNKQWYIPIDSATPIATTVNVPFTQATPITMAGGTMGDSNTYQMFNSRVDVLNSSIANFNARFAAYLKNTNGNWWDAMLDGNPSRFQCSPFVQKPMSAADLAKASPYFLGGCSQFIVEYAGDFLTQDNDPSHLQTGPHPWYGDVIGQPLSGSNPTNIKGDGQLDFFINSNGVKQTIWYGMPRNTSGLPTTCVGNGDVVPFRDWLQNVYNATNGTVLPIENTYFEKTLPAYQAVDYNANMTKGEAQSGYTCAWGPNDPHPKIMLIRITMTLEDPTGRLPEGQTFQYVFPVNPASNSK